MKNRSAVRDFHVKIDIRASAIFFANNRKIHLAHYPKAMDLYDFTWKCGIQGELGDAAAYAKI
jgi:hypothetical protein